MSNENPNTPAAEPNDFIREPSAQDIASGKYKAPVTRFPPEPNGYLHIGHAKSICLNFGIDREFGGQCNLRMDDTNPTKEDVEYVDSITTDVKWLIDAGRSLLRPEAGGKKLPTRRPSREEDFFLPAVVGSHAAPVEPFYASDYFDQIYEWAVELIKRGRPTSATFRPRRRKRNRGAPTNPARQPVPQPLRRGESRLVRAHEERRVPDGKRTLRRKIDMASPNIWLRDRCSTASPRRASSHGRQMVYLPMYDFAHCLSDYIEGITHSICTLEFEVHRRSMIGSLKISTCRVRCHQYEFAKLIPSYTIVSKRKLIQLVNDKVVTGWDDPRMPTISRHPPSRRARQRRAQFRHRRRRHEIHQPHRHGRFDHAIREDLNKRALRRLAVLRPLKLTITNLSPHHYEELDAINNPEDPSTGTRKIPFGNTLYIEQNDFMENPSPKFFR